MENLIKKHQTLDLGTLPSKTFYKLNFFFKAMALNAIVEELMKDETTATVCTNDGSSRSDSRILLFNH